MAHGLAGLMVPRLSIIVPAWNEAALLPACLGSLHASLEARPINHELIVVDNNSSDATPQIAQECGAKVVFEPVNQIARARNAGATEAQGEWLLFIDADSQMSASLFDDVLDVMADENAVGCGSVMTMEGLTGWAAAGLNGWNRVSRICRWAAGSLVLCRAEAFRDAGGFDTELFAAEEIDLSRRLKRWGRQRAMVFRILSKHPLQTSPRKFALYTPREIVAQTWRLLIRPRGALRDRSALGLWYDGRR